MLWRYIESTIETQLGLPFKIESKRPVGGGSINDAYLVEGERGRYFVKINSASHKDMFAAERDGLIELAAANAIRVPNPIACDEHLGQAFLVMEYLPMGRGQPYSAELFGEKLAALHGTVSAQFGWWRNNTIGATPQHNQPSSDWVTFWREHRLGYQIDLACQNGYASTLRKLGDQLLDAVPKFFTDYHPVPSLLHGDLWSGNYGYHENGEPVIFDPAVYCGDRETDIAMTELFGGFPAAFYQAYQAAYPLDKGYSIRKELYNLYHILNHANLFGGGYVQQAAASMRRLLALQDCPA